MSRQICRDFQRGNCRFGTRCKFLHQTGTSQQQQTQQQGSGNNNRFGGGFNNNTSNNNQRAPQQQTAPAKDHKCGNPKVCQDQIKEDVSTEQPTYWRLTSYAHWKFLPNDITGDISPEELRSLAYTNAKQGWSTQQIVQNEQSLVAAKIAEFESLQRNPYRGPAATQGLGGFHQGGAPQPSPFGSSAGAFSGFGAPQTQAPASGAFGQPQTMFGVPVTATPQPGGGFGNAFNKTSTNPKLSPSPFQPSGFGQSSQFAQTGFGSQAPKNIFGSQASQNSNIFGTPAQPSVGNGNSVFGGGFGAQPSMNQPAPASMNPVGFGSSPFTTATAFGTSPFAMPAAATPPPSIPAAAAAVITPNTLAIGSPPPQSVHTAAGVDGVWQKETWKLGEIPEGEPPESIRY